MHIHLLPILALALSTGLHAAVVSSGVRDLAIPGDFDGIYLDFNAFNDPALFSSSTTAPADWDINLFFGGAAIATSDTLQPVTATATTNAAVLGLKSGDVVSDTADYPAGFSGSLDHIGPGPQQWDNGDTAYIGFRLQPDSFPVGNQPANPIYGWMEVTLQNDGNPGVIREWAWDPTGAAVTIPEPGITTLAALSLAGLAGRRRRRLNSR